MPSIHRLKRSFNSGEMSPLMEGRVDFKRFDNGCRKLYNAICVTQGAATNRPGFKFIYDLSSLGLDHNNPEVRQVPFIFSENQSYNMIFFRHISGAVKVVFGYQSSGLILYGNPSPTECPVGTPISPLPNPGDLVVLELPSTWDMNFDYTQSADEMYFAMSGMPPQVIQRYSHTCWVHSSPTFVNTPAEWNATDGYPERVTFHQQRLVFGTNLTGRQTVWMSKAGSFLDFGTSSPLLDSDAVTFTLDSGVQNKIMWLLSVKELDIGTIGGEWTVVGGTFNALTPTNILAQKQTANGSQPIQPLVVGNSVLFVERHGRSVNEFIYDSNYESFKNFDITILAPHLTLDYGIVDWCYQQTPHSIVWSVREDGDMLGLTYQREHEVIGWHHHSTQGKFKSLNTIPGDNREDDVWAVVQRTVGVFDKFYLERLAPFYEGEDLTKLRYLDSYIVYSGSPTNTITGLDHLEGLEVGILAAGSVHPTRVVASGQITLDSSYSHVVVGLKYESEIRPFVSDVPGQYGTALGRMQRITGVDILLYQSENLTIGRDDMEDGEKEEELPFRSPWDTTGTPVPLFSGVRHISFPEGFDRRSEYFIRQKDPYPLTVLAVIDTIEVFE